MSRMATFDLDEALKAAEDPEVSFETPAVEPFVPRASTFHPFSVPPRPREHRVVSPSVSFASSSVATRPPFVDFTAPSVVISAFKTDSVGSVEGDAASADAVLDFAA
jgi:hypothetical protein